MKPNKTTHCLNCGTYIGETNFCHHCGQINSSKRITVRQILKDFFGDYFTLDSKFFRSLFPLLTKPGHLTREYVSGRRVRYVLPLRLYIFTTFVFFFVLALNTKLDQNDFQTGQDTVSVQPLDSLKTMLGRPELMLPNQDAEAALFQQIDTTFVLFYASQYDEKKMQFKYDEADANDGTVERYLENKARYLESLGSQGTALFVKSLINQIPKVLFVMLPFFALILKLLYIRHEIYYIEHFIFALHLHSLIFLLLIITVFFSKWYLFLTVWLGILVYLFLSMHHFYSQNIVKTFVKMNLLLFVYSFALLPAVILLVILAMVSV